MLHRASAQIAYFFCTLHQINDTAKKDELAYGLEIIISALCSISCVLLIAIIFGHTDNYVIFLLTFVPLRSYSGGYHAKTHLMCWFLLAVVFVVEILFIYFTSNLILFITSIILVLIGALLIVLYAPVPSKNRPVSKRQLAYNKRRCRVLLGIAVIMCIVFMYFNHLQWLFSVAYAVFVTAISLKIKRKGG